MADKEATNSFSEEEKQRLAGSETAEEAKKTPAEAPAQPLDDETLEGAAGGLSGGRQTLLPLSQESGVLI